MSEKKADSITRTLSGASFAVTVDRSRQGRNFLVGAVLLAATVSAAAYYLVPGDAEPSRALNMALASQKAENEKLRLEVAELKMNLGHERATRESLERESASQAEALKQANKNLSFYRSHAGNVPQGGQ